MTGLARISPIAASTKEEEEEEDGEEEEEEDGEEEEEEEDGEEEGEEEGEREREREGKSHMETVLVQLWPQAWGVLHQAVSISEQLVVYVDSLHVRLVPQETLMCVPHLSSLPRAELSHASGESCSSACGACGCTASVW